MAKKKRAKKTGAMFPEPSPINIGPVGIDVENQTLIVDSKHREAIEKLAAAERARLDFRSRIKRYSETTKRILLKHYGETRPQHVPVEIWDDLQTRIRRVDLSKNAPGLAKDALRIARGILKVSDILKSIEDWPDEIDAVFCELIDVGKLLQRLHDRQFEADVAAARASEAGRQSRVQQQQTAAAKRKQDIVAEFERRKKQKPKMSAAAIYAAMADVKIADGKPKYGSVHTIKKHIREANKQDNTGGDALHSANK